MAETLLDSWRLAREVPATLRDVEPESLIFLRNNTVSRKLRPNELAVDVNDLNAGVFFVVEGLLVAECSHPTKGYVPTRFMTWAQGLTPAFNPQEPSPVRLRAITPCVIAVTPLEAILAACETWPKFSLGYTVSLVQRMNKAHTLQARITHMPLAAQIAFLMWGLVAARPSMANGDRNFPFKLPQSLIALYFGVSREEIGRKVKQLMLEGYLTKVSGGCTLSGTLPELFKQYGAIPYSETFSASEFLEPTPTLAPSTDGGSISKPEPVQLMEPTPNGTALSLERRRLVIQGETLGPSVCPTLN